MKFRLLSILALTVCSLFPARFAAAGSATWNASPASGDWNTPANWTPATVPNGPSDIALFATSNKTAVSLSASVAVDAITFNSGPSSYTVTASASTTLTLTGAGIIDNSAIMQTFVAEGRGAIDFTKSATVGPGSSLSNKGGTTSAMPGGITNFFDTSSAGAALITNDGGPQNGFSAHGNTNFFDRATAGQATVTNNAGTNLYGGGGATNFANSSSAGDAVFANKTGTMVYSGTVAFVDTATAGSASFTNDGGTSSSFSYAMVTFNDNTSAGNATITNGGGIGELGYPGDVEFYASADAGTAVITNAGSIGGDALGGVVRFYDNTSASNSTITLQGGLVFAGAGGVVSFNNTATAGNSLLIAENAGVPEGGGGYVLFFDDSSGGEARVQVFGSGMFDLSFHNAPGVTIGSLEGDGAVFLGSNNLTVGSNNLNAVFSGTIQDGTTAAGGSLSKIGKGRLLLDMTNTYTGGTTVIKGTLLVANRFGSATGPGAVQVNAGTLSGIGKIYGPVTLGTGGGRGAFLSPGKSAHRPGTLRLHQTLTFQPDSAYKCVLDRASLIVTQVAANGVTINGAQFAFADLRSGSVTTGTVLTVINNTSANPITGEFSNLADGSTFTSSGGTTFLVSYEGGTGNDLTLTVL
ncbi:MAG: hypothetical protein ABI946_12205 [Chthoniobacterales bacterium]